MILKGGRTFEEWMLIEGALDRGIAVLLTKFIISMGWYNFCISFRGTFYIQMTAENVNLTLWLGGCV